MANTNSEFDKELDQLRSDMADLRKDMASLVKTMKDAGVEQGQHFYEQAADRARHTRDEARKAFGRTLKRFEAKYPKAMECLAKDREEMLAFYDYPA